MSPSSTGVMNFIKWSGVAPSSPGVMNFIKWSCVTVSLIGEAVDVVRREGVALHVRLVQTTCIGVRAELVRGLIHDGWSLLLASCSSSCRMQFVAFSIRKVR